MPIPVGINPTAPTPQISLVFHRGHWVCANAKRRPLY